MFGYGNGTRHDSEAFSYETGRRVRKTFDNGMAAHVWAQVTQTFGQSNNGNLFWHGRRLFSYGGHYIAGYVMPALGGDTRSRGVTLINDSSYSVSTGGHVRNAWGAARGEVIRIKELTAVANAIDSAIEEHGARLRPDVPAAPIAWGKVRKSLRAFLLARFSEIETYPGEEAARSLFHALGYRDAVAMAARVERAHAKAVKARKQAVAKEREEESLDLAKRAANTSPEDMTARVVEEARKAAGHNWRYTGHTLDQWEEKGRELHRAAKAAKAKGWTRIAANTRAVYRALREALPEFEAATTRAFQREQWGRFVRDIRTGIAIETGAPMPQGTRHTANPRYLMGEAVEATEKASEAVTTWAKPYARLVGLSGADMLPRLHDLKAVFERRLQILESEQVRAARRDSWGRIRKGLQAVEGGPAQGTVGNRLDAINAALRVVSNYTPLRLSASTLESIRKVPGAWAVAGVTVEKLESFESVLKDAQAYLQSVKRAEEERLAALEAERLATAEKDARATWRAGGSNAYPGRYGHAQRVTSCEDGGAMLRAVSVTRDESGQITGGRLETSQSADVPLTHALRAFRFLKHCRDTGKGWRANGQRLRVGHFEVDHITAKGDFKAGCHQIKWKEVARLAERLGVADLAPAVTTEEKATA